MYSGDGAEERSPEPRPLGRAGVLRRPPRPLAYLPFCDGCRANLPVLNPLILMEATRLPGASGQVPSGIRHARPSLHRDGGMSVRSAIALVRMALLFFLAESPFVSVPAGLYPGHVAAIVLTGALVVAAPLGIVIVRALRASSEEELAEKYRKSERLYFLTAAVSLVGVIMTSLGGGAVGTPGIVVSAAGMSAALWLLLKATPARGRRDSRFPIPADRGHLQ
jgi:hypothetical protein